MEETVQPHRASQHQGTDGSSGGVRDSSPAESASRAVARLLANPRRTRRD
ncbi:hypothetical protein [Blastococcus xanthinilyticus]|uniref:Uncharacterized protein n=1 Tax=Blastococcus xanthinilyticus TaxID=1564164 RepID=A0A5S5CVX4_9ACTN|nr:hypothetical protein [Blastococcus xanthinilyticus]TYP87940.1 hypothetical protein BD833_105115 [Blastococcus xanthinilyticus]